MQDSGLGWLINVSGDHNIIFCSYGSCNQAGVTGLARLPSSLLFGRTLQNALSHVLLVLPCVAPNPELRGSLIFPIMQTLSDIDGGVDAQSRLTHGCTEQKVHECSQLNLFVVTGPMWVS